MQHKDFINTRNHPKDLKRLCQPGRARLYGKPKQMEKDGQNSADRTCRMQVLMGVSSLWLLNASSMAPQWVLGIRGGIEMEQR